jgi:hypothetical protein
MASQRTSDDTLIRCSNQLRSLTDSAFIRSRRPSILILDPLIDLFSMDDSRGPGLDTKTDLLAFNLHDYDFDIVANGDSFANFSGKYQHAHPPWFS